MPARRAPGSCGPGSPSLDLPSIKPLCTVAKKGHIKTCNKFSSGLRPSNPEARLTQDNPQGALAQFVEARTTAQ
ncbi:Electrogenic Sodium Bicarbonate Cotransporter 4 [Manis pentadactyla]|nr:Electrogenic Sodium Bicarbonate Cotransporter 4 [Manis pentadactyla]